MKRISPIKPNTYTLNTYEHIRCALQIKDKTTAAGSRLSGIPLFLCFFVLYMRSLENWKENGELCLRYKHVCPVTSTAQSLPHHHDPCVLSWHKASFSCSLIHKRPPQRTDLCVWFGRFWSQLFFLILPVSPPGPRVSSQCGVAVPNNHCTTWTISWIHSYVYQIDVTCQVFPNINQPSGNCHCSVATFVNWLCCLSHI